MSLFDEHSINRVIETSFAEVNSYFERLPGVDHSSKIYPLRMKIWDDHVEIQSFYNPSKIKIDPIWGLKDMGLPCEISDIHTITSCVCDSLSTHVYFGASVLYRVNNVYEGTIESSGRIVVETNGYDVSKTAFSAQSVDLFLTPGDRLDDLNLRGNRIDFYVPINCNVRSILKSDLKFMTRFEAESIRFIRNSQVMLYIIRADMINCYATVLFNARLSPTSIDIPGYKTFRK